MYTRKIQAPIDSPVQNKKPVVGTWTAAFKKVDLLDIERPYSIPLPRWMRDLRIKEWQSFFIQNDDMYFGAFIANLKYFRFIAATFYNKKTDAAPVSYFDYFPLSFWNLPKTLSDSVVFCRAPGYFITIHDWLDASLINLDLNIESSGGHPSINALFELCADSKKSTPMAVNLLYSEESCLYTYKTFVPARGNLKLGDQDDYTFLPEYTTGIFCDGKGIFPYITHSTWISGSGFDKKNRRIGFALGENQAKGANRDNENALWIDGELTLLPPVRITQAGSSEDEWVIEDIEGMIDLTFTPKHQTEIKSFTLIISKAEFHNPIGTFNGFLMSKDGEKIDIHNLFGCVERLYLRL
ncbi:MAG: DUF2804 domain-containing protein [Spirochaetaceae bacterium]|jgi:hypothetical protein|nr:DUF2804 domain-containing protein [Spirochaetaceae bacterium]